MGRGAWRFASACVIGASHLAGGKPCQDAAETRLLSTPAGPVLVSVVCDGAGSAAQAEIGAGIAATRFADRVDLYFERGGSFAEIERPIAEQWLSAVTDQIKARAAADQHQPRDYNCTLLAAIIGVEAAIFLQIGDGAIVVSQGSDDGWSWVFWPMHGEFANQTVFILSEEAGEALEFCKAPGPIEELAIFSDGLERMVLHTATRTVNDAFFNHMAAPLRRSAGIGLDRVLSGQLGTYLGSPAINGRTSDDKTLVIATRRCLDQDPTA